MKKRALVMGLALSLLTTGCSIPDFRSLIESRNVNADSSDAENKDMNTDSSNAERSTGAKEDSYEGAAGTDQVYGEDYDFGGYDPSQPIEIELEGVGPVVIKQHEKDYTQQIGFLIYDKQGNQIGYFNPQPMRGKLTTAYDSYDAVGFGDFNFDGYTDMVVIGDAKFGKTLEYCFGSYIPEEGEKAVSFTGLSAISVAAENYIGADYTIEKALDFIYNGHESGIFDSYQEAYDHIINLELAESGDPTSYKYSLVNIDGDEIPELIIDMAGYSVAIYTFRDGHLYTCMGGGEYKDIDPNGLIYFPGQNAFIIHYSYYEYGEEIITHYLLSITEDHKVTGKEITEEEIDQIVENYKAKNIEKSYFKGELFVADMLKKFGTATGKVTKLEGDDISFNVGEKKYTFKATDAPDYTKTYVLSDGVSTTSDDIFSNTYKLYLMEKEGGRSFLYLFVDDENHGCNIFIYNLNNESLSSPYQYEGNYGLYNGEIEDYYSFSLQCIANLVGTTVLQKSFYVGFDGVPLSSDRYGRCIGVNALNDGKPIPDHGETIVTKKDIRAMTSEDIDSREFKEEKIIPAGTRLTMYKTDGYKFVDYYTDDGLGVRLEVRDSVINGEYSVNDFDDVPYVG